MSVLMAFCLFLLNFKIKQLVQVLNSDCGNARVSSIQYDGFLIFFCHHYITNNF